MQSYFTSPQFPLNLPKIWNAEFGFTVQKNLSVIPSEWGGQYGKGDLRDKAVQDTLVAYFVDSHICSSFYWAWNANSQ